MAIQNPFDRFKYLSLRGLRGMLAGFDAKNAYYLSGFSNFTKKP
ncbi:hypothetical protein [Nostoc sp. CHAB 5715]|nr:hypothetical protein [Nostoc sp. CHAB 5715]